MRVLVTGSRNWTDFGAIRRALERARAEAIGRFDKLTVVHGDAPSGADHIAHQWAEATGAAWDVLEERHPADWDQWHGAAGIYRNSDMVKLGADLCLAFILPCSKRNCWRTSAHGSHGATDCRDKALAAGIRTISNERWS